MLLSRERPRFKQEQSWRSPRLHLDLRILNELPLKRPRESWGRSLSRNQPERRRHCPVGFPSRFRREFRKKSVGLPGRIKGQYSERDVPAPDPPRGPFFKCTKTEEFASLNRKRGPKGGGAPTPALPRAAGLFFGTIEFCSHIYKISERPSKRRETKRE